MVDSDRSRTAVTLAPVGALTCGGLLFFGGVALGLAAAVRFREALLRSAAGCGGVIVGHGMAWWAVATSVGGIAAAALAIVAEYRRQRRPVAVVVGAVMAGAGVFGVALNLFIVHEIDTCAALFG